MKKRVSFLCVLSLIVQMLLPFAMITAMADEPIVYTVPDSPAEVYNMNFDWKFKKASDSARYPLAAAAASVVDANGRNFYEKEFDDSSWETVSVPHPVNAEDSFDGNCYDAGEAGLFRGFMFYRKNITIPASDAGKKMFLEFESVRQTVYLYVNGELVGFYEAGVTAMGFDITDKIIPGEDNLIAVATDNASDRGESDRTKITAETRPGSAAGAADGYGFQWNTKDFNEVQGGITGNVNLYVKGNVYQTLPLYNNLKTTGNYIYATDFNIREGKATVTVEGEIRNESDADENVSLEVNIVEMVDPNKDETSDDADHTKQPYLVASFTSNNTNAVVAGDKGIVYKSMVPEDAYAFETGGTPAPTDTSTVDVTKLVASAPVEGLKFWSPDAPNLYDVYTVLKNNEGKVLDVQKITTGFRKVEYDITDGGLKINDVPVWLTGYAQRSTNEWAVIGVANDWLQDLDMQWIKESNSNFIRWMHVAPKPVQIRSGDKYGVVSVVPAGDKEADVSDRAWDQRVEAMRDATIYFRNSPSVLFWEAGNNAVSAEHQQEMTDLKQTLDPNGGRFAGCRTLSSVDQIKATEYVGTMLNRHASGAKASMATAKKYVPIMETEYAREEAPRRVWDDFSPPDYDYDNKWLGGASKKDGYDVHDLTSEDFAVVDVNAYNEFYSDRVGGSSGNDYYSAAGIMVWSDSNMHNRNTGSENCRTSGKVDPVRIKKQAFYALQAAQSTTPKIHIIGHWNYPQISDDTYNYPEKTFNGTYWEKTGTMGKRDPRNKTVYVIGSAGLSKVELYVNDVLKGTSTKPTNTFVYSFPGIDVTESGKVSAKAYNAQNEVVAEHEIATVGEAKTIKLTPVTGPDGLIADGSDIAYFDLAVVDENGNTCPLAYDKINLSVNGEGVLLGGYNSGVGDKITTNKDYCYAECGTNRIFVRSTRNAGTIVLSASLEGQPAVTSTITSTDDLAINGGLTTKAQRSFEQGEVVQVVMQEVEPMKTLSSAFTANFAENGNTYIDDGVVNTNIYTMKVNGVEVSGYVNNPYRPDTTTGVLCDVIKTLEAAKAVNSDIAYTVVTEGDVPAGYDGTLPMVSITGGLKDGTTQLDIINGSTTLFINNGQEKNLLNAQIEAKGDELIVDIGAVIGYLDGVSYSMNDNTKTSNIVGSVSGDTTKAIIEYANGSARVIAKDAFADANLIFASYDETGKLVSVDFKKVALDKTGAFNDYTPSAKFTKTNDVKVMLWASDMATPLAAAAGTNVAVSTPAEDTAETLSIDEMTVTFANNADKAVLYAETLPIDETYAKVILDEKYNDGTLTDGPDGTSYTQLTSETKIMNVGSASSSEIYMSFDFRIDDAAAYMRFSNGKNKTGPGLSLADGVLRNEYKGNTYQNLATGIEIGKWYSLELDGKFVVADANVTARVYKWEDGQKTLINTIDSLQLRNFYAGSGNGDFEFIKASGISVDNEYAVSLYGTDVTVTSLRDDIKAGETAQLSATAQRNGKNVTTPGFTWAVYNEAGTELLNDENVTISETGLLSAGAKTATQTVTVRATATSKGNPYGDYKVNIKAVDTSGDKYDKLVLTAENEKSTVRAGEPITIIPKATMGDTEVTLADGDVIWSVYNAENLRAVGNNGITITANGVLSVANNVVPQTLTVRGTNKSGAVTGTYTVQVLPSGMNYGNEDNYTDTYVSADACEEYLSAKATLNEGSWDGSGYYTMTTEMDFTGFPSDTNSDVIYSADMQFANDGAGWTIYSNNRGKLGLQLSSSGTTLNAIGAGNKTVGSMTIDKDAWYNIQCMCKTGGNSYAIMMVYKYDENGKKVNPNTGAENVPYILTCALRNLSESQANHIAITAGTNVDNVLNMYIAPNELKLSLDAETVLAGGSAQASTVALRNGIEFPSLSSGLITYAIYDADNKYPIADDKITIGPDGKIEVDAMAAAQDVYVRVLSTSGGMSDSKKLTIKSSDIFEVTTVGFKDDTYSKFTILNVIKNFEYENDVTFISAVYGADGTMKAITTKKAYGDQLALGANRVAMNMDMPKDFSAENDKFNAFIVTKLSTSKKTEGADLTVAAADNAVSVTNIPTFDASAKVVVLVLKPGADEESVKDSDIAYFNQINAADITDNSLTIPVTYESGMKVKISGTVSGLHTISAN